MALFLIAALKEAGAAVETAITAKLPPARFYKIEHGTWVIDSEAIGQRSF